MDNNSDLKKGVDYNKAQLEYFNRIKGNIPAVEGDKLREDLNNFEMPKRPRSLEEIQNSYPSNLKVENSRKLGEENSRGSR